MLLFWRHNRNDRNLDNILKDEKSYENILIYNVEYKTLDSAKPLCIIFNKIEGYIRKYDSTMVAQYLSLGHSNEKHDKMGHVMLKSNILDTFS